MTSERTIDAVITWVDGSDPVHKSKRLAALNQGEVAAKTVIAAGTDNIRFTNNGELRYCLASIKKHAPWIRTIHLITDNQKPQFLTQNDLEIYCINIVDHTQLFHPKEKALPTFNSRTLETALFRIENLADQFIYFNDDFLLLQKVTPDDFFSEGKVVLRGVWKKLSNFNSIYMLKNKFLNLLAKKFFGINRTMHLLAQMRGARLAGYESRYYRSPHVPHPMNKNTLAQYYQKNPDDFLSNVRFQFRDTQQHWPISLTNHLEIRQHRATLKDEKGILIINGERQTSRQILNRIDSIRKNEAAFLCLQSLEKISKNLRIEIGKVLNERFDIR